MEEEEEEINKGNMEGEVKEKSMKQEEGKKKRI